MVDGFEDLLVELTGFGRVEGKTESQECVGETLDTKADGAVTEVAAACFFDWIVVDFDDFVEVASHDLRDFMKLFEVITSCCRVDIAW